jgi:hypothetical protein
MHNLTPEEQSTISRYLTDRRSRTDIFFQYAIYFVPSLLFGLYGMWKGDIGAMAVAYVVLVGLVVYLIQQQARTNPSFRSAIGKLGENSGPTSQAAAGSPVLNPPLQ